MLQPAFLSPPMVWRRFGLCVLNQVVTSNHKHRLVHDPDPDVYPGSMHRMAERMSQVYNQRKVCNGAFRDG